MKDMKLGAFLLALLAMSAIMASPAFATEEFQESGSAAYIGPSPGTKLTGAKVLKIKAAEGLSLTTTISGKQIKTQATGLNCLSCTIENSGTNAVGKGSLEATGVSLVEPEPTVCSDGSIITTKLVKAVLGMKKGSATIATIKFTPAEGETFETAEIRGASCSIKGTYKVTGALYAEASNATGVFAKTQTLKFSKAIQESAGTATSLKFGANGAFVTATASGFLEGEPEWAAKEK